MQVNRQRALELLSRSKPELQARFRVTRVEISPAPLNRAPRRMSSFMAFSDLARMVWQDPKEGQVGVPGRRPKLGGDDFVKALIEAAEQKIKLQLVQNKMVDNARHFS